MLTADPPLNVPSNHVRATRAIAPHFDEHVRLNVDLMTGWTFITVAVVVGLAEQEGAGVAHLLPQ